MTSRNTPFILAVTLLTTLGLQRPTASAQGTAFTYQGRLTESGALYTGSAEFQATLWDAESGGAQVAANTPSSLITGVTNGLFVLPLDFGGTPFDTGAGRWLQLEVRTTIGPFTPLTPRQRLTATPYALTASSLSGTLPAAQLTGTLQDAQLSANVSRLDQTIESAEITDGTIVNADISGSAAIADSKLAMIITAGKVANSATTATSANTANTIVVRDASGNFTAGTVTAAFSGNGAGLTGLNASQLSGGTVPDARLSATVSRSDHTHDTRYYQQSVADDLFLNATGPERLGANSSFPALTVWQTNTSSVALDATTASTANGKAAIVGHAAGSSGISINSVAGVLGDSDTARGVIGVSKTNDGVLGWSTSGTGVNGQSPTGRGVYGWSSSGYAVYGSGKMHATGNITTDGTVTADKVIYNTVRTHYLSLGPMAFELGSEASTTTVIREFFGVGFYVTSGPASLAGAPVNLPQGAIVRRIKLYLKDNASACDMVLRLNRLKLSDGSADTLASVQSSGASTLRRMYSDTTISFSTVDNSEYAYEVTAVTSGSISWSEAGSDVILYGVIIEYTVSEAE